MNVIRRTHVLILPLAASLLLGCGVRNGAGPAEASDPARSGAALARVVVRNETAQPLVIAFRPAASPGGEVIVGRVGAREQVLLAPVPADEPIILLARTPERRQLQLPPRTFQIRDRWEWRIPADAPFREPSSDRTH